LLIAIVGGVIVAMSLTIRVILIFSKSDTSTPPAGDRRNGQGFRPNIPYPDPFRLKKRIKTKPEMGAQSGQVMTAKPRCHPDKKFQTGVKTTKARHGTGIRLFSGPADREPE